MLTTASRYRHIYVVLLKALHTATHDTHLPRLSFSSDEPHRECATLKASTPNLILYIPVGHLEHTDSKMTKHYGSSRP